MVVFGAGAVGSLWGALLARAGEEVRLIGSPDHVRAIRERGLRVEGSLEGTWPVTAQEEWAEADPADVILLTVKAFDLDRASRLLAPHLTDRRPVLLPQNGLGIETIVQRALAEAHPGLAAPPLVRAVNTVPATLLAPGRVRFAGSGELRFPRPSGDDALDRATRTFHDLFERAGVTARYVSDFDTVRWTKAVVNAAINPLTAANGVPNGAVAASPYREMAEELLAEGIRAARAAGHPLDEAGVRSELWHTVEATAANRSSMLQDVDRGRPTELDVISGALLRIGEDHGVAMPATAAIIDRVRSRLAVAGQRS